jgi:hypothetical protein
MRIQPGSAIRSKHQHNNDTRRQWPFAVHWVVFNGSVCKAPPSRRRPHQCPTRSVIPLAPPTASRTNRAFRNESVDSLPLPTSDTLRNEQSVAASPSILG